MGRESAKSEPIWAPTSASVMAAIVLVSPPSQSAVAIALSKDLGKSEKQARAVTTDSWASMWLPNPSRSRQASPFTKHLSRFSKTTVTQ